MKETEIIVQQINELLVQAAGEGIVDDQFFQLLQLQDDSNPDFVSEVVDLYLEDSAAKLQRLGSCLSVSAPNFSEFDQIVHQFKGSSASFGAAQMAAICVRMREAGHAQDVQASRALLQELNVSMVTLRGRLEMFAQLESQRKICQRR